MSIAIHSDTANQKLCNLCLVKSKNLTGRAKIIFASFNRQITKRNELMSSVVWDWLLFLQIRPTTLGFFWGTKLCTKSFPISQQNIYQDCEFVVVRGNKLYCNWRVSNVLKSTLKYGGIKSGKLQQNSIKQQGSHVFLRIVHSRGREWVINHVSVYFICSTPIWDWLFAESSSIRQVHEYQKLAF